MNKGAEEYAKEMKEISPAEFFEKNRHFLGYENPVKSLLTVDQGGAGQLVGVHVRRRHPSGHIR